MKNIKGNYKISSLKETLNLVRYNHIVRRLYHDALKKLPWNEVVEPLGLSFDSLRNVFLHLTIVEDRWINYIMPGKFKEWVDPDFDNFKDFQTLEKYMQRVHNKTEAYISQLKTEELIKLIIIPWGDKPNTKIAIETALTHMVVEDLIHYGELSAVLWQKGLEAPYFGFWRYEQGQKHALIF